MPKKLDLIGKRFGRLKVIAEFDTYHIPEMSQKHRVWYACKCGTTGHTLVESLRSGQTKSCGCLRKEQLVKRSLKHGEGRRKKRTNTYQIWLSMNDRCSNPKNKHFKNYGGRGIEVCKRWKNYTNFIKDVGHCPKGLTLDRIKNNLGYFPKNIRWATRTEQNRNSRKNRIITVRGVTGCLSELCQHFNVPYHKTLWRIRHGWTIEDAFYSA